MTELKVKGFNEIFLNEINRFDARTYAYDTFFNCDEVRFKKIARQYGSKFGGGALDYMYKTFYSWKSNYVSPNSSSRYNIISSTLATFTPDEKFYAVYTELARFIHNKFPGYISLDELNTTYSGILDRIQIFKIDKNHYTNYLDTIFKEEEELIYIKFISQLFIQYTQIIFENINKDIFLIHGLYVKLNTTFMTTKFSTYLFNIDINTKEFAKKKFIPTNKFTNDKIVSYDNLMLEALPDLSIENITEIAKSNNKTKIDAVLTESLIENIANQKKDIELTKKGGIVSYTLKTNAGFLKVEIRILSALEKLLIVLRIILFVLSIVCLTVYCFIFTESYFIFVVGIVVLQFLVTPIFTDIVKFFKDKLKNRTYGRK